ncbi:hypothetical protein HanPI659440_Chr13g0522931 [Helianthus annuus]|nr:hypothetical protein HanPI659440_Chr13g0522931 [Helianthus annuus]
MVFSSHIRMCSHTHIYVCVCLCFQPNKSNLGVKAGKKQSSSEDAGGKIARSAGASMTTKPTR